MRLASNTAPLAVAQLGFNVLLLVSTVFLARVLGPAGYGLFAIGLGVYGLTAFVGDGGLGLWGMRVIADDPDPWPTVCRLTAARFVTMAVALGVAFLAVAIVPLPSGSRPTAQIMVLAIVPAGLSLDYALIGLERNGLSGISRLATGVAMLVLAPALAVAYGSLGAAVGYLLATTVGAIMTWVLFIHAAGRPRLVFPRAVAYTLARSLPMGLNSVLAQIYRQADSLVIGIVLGAAAAGVYSAPTRLLTGIATFGWVLGSSLLPIYRALDDESETAVSELATKATQLLLIACLPALGVGIGGATVIVAAILGPTYADSVPVLRIGSIAAAMALCTVPAAYVILARRHDTRYTLATAVAAFVAIPMVWYSAIAYGIVGVAVSMLVAEVLSCSLLLHGARRSGLQLGTLRSTFFWAALAGLAAGLATSLATFSLVGVIALGLIVEIPFAALIVRELRRSTTVKRASR